MNKTWGVVITGDKLGKIMMQQAYCFHKKTHRIRINYYVIYSLRKT